MLHTAVIKRIDWVLQLILDNSSNFLTARNLILSSVVKMDIESPPAIKAKGPAKKLIGVAERMEVVITNVSLGQLRVPQPK